MAQNHRTTDRQTDGHCDSMTESAQCNGADSVKIQILHQPGFPVGFGHKPIEPIIYQKFFMKN